MYGQKIDNDIECQKNKLEDSKKNDFKDVIQNDYDINLES